MRIPERCSNSDNGVGSSVSTSPNDLRGPLAIRRLELLTAELEASQEEAHRLSRAVSHNLSTPLTSTRWLLEALRDRSGPALDDDGIRLIEAALKNLDEMVGMLESLVSHSAVGQKTLHATQLASSRRALDQALANLRSEAASSGAEFSVADLPSVPVEPNALTCLFENLVSNALKFKRPGVAPCIAVTASREGEMWVLAVTDQGIGIEPGDYRRIFEPFQRVHPGIPGRGIGLATCRKIVERTGGRIWVDCKPGESTAFRFTLPADYSET